MFKGKHISFLGKANTVSVTQHPNGETEVGVMLADGNSVSATYLDFKIAIRDYKSIAQYIYDMENLIKKGKK